MITYLYGTDRFRIKEYLREHAAGAMVGEEALKMQGLFGQSPVILYDPSKDLEIPEDLEVFVVSEKKIKKGLEFKPLQGVEIRQWIQEEVKKAGFTIAPDALALLAGQYKDTWQTKLELDKTLNYTQTKNITKQDLEAVSTASVEQNIFQLTDAIANRQKRDAFLLLTRQLASGADPYYLFSMVVYQFRNMLAPGRPGVHPYAAQKARLAAQRFDSARLKAMYRNLHQLEIDAKNGEQDMAEGLYRLVFSL